MASLIFKDLMLCKKSLPIILIYGILMIFIFGNSTDLDIAGFVATTVAVVYLLMSRAAAYDDVDKAEMLLLCLPVSRTKIVIAKYLSIIVFTALGILAYIICALVYKLLALPIQTTPITIEAMVGAFAGVTVLAAIFFPVYFKVGFVKSRFFTVILFLIAFCVPSLVLSKLQSQDIAWFNQVMHFFQNQSDAVIVALFLGGCLVLLIVSILVSLKFYNQREF